jgi:hypothetical protein
MPMDVHDRCRAPCRSCGRDTPHHRPRTETGIFARNNIVVMLLFGRAARAIGDR